jgi:hypothetical protein
MEYWNIGFMLKAVKRLSSPNHHSNIPPFRLIPPTPPLVKGGEGGLKLGCLTQIGPDDLGMILNDLRGTFCNPLSEI